MNRPGARTILVAGAPVLRASPALAHPLRACLADLFLTRWAVAFSVPRPRARGLTVLSSRAAGAPLNDDLRDRLVLVLLRLALGDPWLERLTPFRPSIEFRLGIEAETFRVRLSFTSYDVVFFTPTGRPLGLKACFECVAGEMEAIVREAQGGGARHQGAS